MKKLLFKFFLALIIILITASTVFADIIILTNGDIIVGDIIAENETSIVVRTSFGDLTIQKSDIVEIKKDNSIEKGEIVEVFLYDGSRIRGVIIEDTATILKLQTELGLVDIPKSNISNIITGGTTDSEGFGLGIDTGTSGMNEEYFDKLLQYKNEAIFVDLFTFQDSKQETWYIRQGDFILSEIDFLKTIGKFELANQIEQDRLTKKIFFWTFISTTTAFSVATGIGLYGAFFDGDATITDQDWTLLAVGGAFTALSIIGMVSSAPKELYLTYNETKKYAAEYNTKIRRQLGLSVQDVGIFGGGGGGNPTNKEYSDDGEEIKSENYNYDSPIITVGIIPIGLSFNLFIYINF